MERYEREPELVMPLTRFEVSPLYSEQLAKFTMDSIRATPVMNFDPAEALVKLGLEKLQEEPVVCVDIGGDTVAAGLAWLSGDTLVFDEQFKKEHKSTDGAGYLAMLEEISHYATGHGFPVGVSYAGPIADSKPLAGQNVQTFMSELNAIYDCDFANLFPTLAVVRNDAPAGLISGALQAKKEQPVTTNVIYIINGSGLGGAALAGYGNELYAAEPGHIAVIPKLNPEEQQKACGFMGNEYTCIENIAGSKAGIENIWLRNTGEALTGRELEDRYKAGDDSVAHLYNDSAVLVAHAAQGIANAFNFDLASKATVVVGHGGAFKFPEYGNRVQQVLEYSLGQQPRLLMTKDYSSNACLDGAALSALLQIAR